jgi:acetyl/propionyl-CoA carboxylase alpha subunit
MSPHAFDGRWKVDGAVHAVSGQIDETRVTGLVDGRAVEIGIRSTTSDFFVGGVRTRVAVQQRGGRILLSIGGRAFEFERLEGGPAAAGAAEAFDPFAVSPMTGLVTKVHVTKGDRVAKGAPLFAVEAMKMEYVVKADRDVVIAEVKVAAGARIAINEPGVTFETGPSS